MLLFSVQGYAQTARTVSMVLSDSSSGEPVAFATVSLTKKGASNPDKYVLSSDTGKAVIEKVSAGTYTLKAELMGYVAYTKEITVGKEGLDLGTIKMDQDLNLLDAASVSAAGNPILIKKDTVEYNASSFKTTDNDMLENLLKKLPGVEVNEDGTITANGNTISKITIDGKTFFLDDPQLATKNIPAKIIEKVKVVQKKSEQAEFTGIDDGNEETVIDLSVQKGMMNGLIGNVMLGGGHDYPEESYRNEYGNGDFRYQGSAFLGKFTESTQLSAILNGNNTNNRGFNDMASSMMAGMRGGGGGMGRGQGGFGSGNGITTSWMGGINGGGNFFDDRMELMGNYLYNGSEKFVTESSDQTTFLDNYNLKYHNDGQSTTNTYGHRFGFRLDHKFSDNTSILFQPQFSFGGGDFAEFSDFRTDREYADGRSFKTNDGFNQNLGDSRTNSANGMLLLRQKLGIPGRTLSLSANYSFSNSTMDGFNQSITNSYEEDGTMTASPINQRYDQNQNSNSLSGRLTYTEPLGRGFYIEGNYELSWNKNTSKKNTFDSGINDNFAEDRLYNTTGETPNEDYSSMVTNRYIRQRIGANVMYQNSKIRAQLGITANPTNTHNETNGLEYNNKVVNWAPQAMFSWDKNDNTNLRFFYNGSTSQPSTSQLLSVPDNTNPLSISFGNIRLEPYFTHRFRGNFSFSNPKTFTSFRVMLNGSLVQNPIVNATWYGLNGAQYSMPVNGHNSGSLSGNIMFNSPIARSNFSISNTLSGSYAQSSSYIGSTFDMTGYYDPDSGSMDYDAFFKDYPDLDASSDFTRNNIRSVSATERLRLTYRNDFVELIAGGRTSINKSWYTISAASTDMTWNSQVSGSMNWTIPGGLGFVAEANYNWYEGYTTPQDDEVILNVEISKLLFKDQLTLTLKGYDLLNQAKNLSVTDASNYHTETVNNTLGRYIILSLTWRFGSFGGMKSRMGGPGPGRGPGGPGGPPHMRM